MAKGKTSLTFLWSVLLTLVLYLAAQMILSVLAVKSILPEKNLMQAQLVTCAAATFCGGIFASRRTSMGTLSASLANAGLMMGSMLLVGLLAYNHINWTGQGGLLLAAAAIGGVLGGVAGGGKKKRKKARHKHVRPTVK